jgi:hypothetical protein
MSKNLRVRLGSYFYKWRDELQGFKFGTNVHIKELLIRLWKLKLSTSFNTWKNGKDHSKIV